MLEIVRLLILVVAAGIDALLLLALCSRRNRPIVRLPVLLLTLGVWLWHVGLLLALLCPAALVPLTLLPCCVGALLMPCALAHTLIRLERTGLARREGPDLRHALVYLPLLLLTALPLLAAAPADDPLAPLRPFVFPYLLGISVLNLLAAVTFARLASEIRIAPARPFFTGMAWLSVGRVLLAWLLYFLVPWSGPSGESYAVLAAALLPTATVLFFLYFVVKHNLLSLTVERSLVYAGLVMAVFVVHQLAFQEMTLRLPADLRKPAVLLEAIVLAGLVLSYAPLRQRSAEALRYLLGERVAGVRAGLRSLAAELAAHSGMPPLALVDWFGATLGKTLGVDFVAGWLFGPDDRLLAACGNLQRLEEQAARALCGAMASAGTAVLAHRDGGEGTPGLYLTEAGASLAILRTHRAVRGLILIGRHRRNRELSEEEASAVLLLVEQLTTTIDNGLLQSERLAAERRAAQSEQLSALGLLASSITHEVKNPLSAIKVIATVLAEELGEASPHAEDVRLILSEVQRLTTTATQLLDFARPHPSSEQAACVNAALDGTLRILRHLARQGNVALEDRLAENLPRVRAGEDVLREIFFNLLSNALRAAGPGGRVRVRSGLHEGVVVAEVWDSGPGLPAEVRMHLFEPFLSTEADGTGLGLYVVGRRIRELGGRIECAPAAVSGTLFTVQFPGLIPGLEDDR